MTSLDINSEITRRLDELTHRLDRLETDLPAVPAKAIGVTRAVVHRVNGTAADVANDVGRQLGQLTTTATAAWSTSIGQARSAVERTSSTARRTSKETIGQARAQTKRTGAAAQTATTALLDDAARAIDPDGDGRPASLQDWSKAELYERAQELEIEGRSSMSKPELVRALRSA